MPGLGGVNASVSEEAALRVARLTLERMTGEKVDPNLTRDQILASIQEAKRKSDEEGVAFTDINISGTGETTSPIEKLLEDITAAGEEQLGEFRTGRQERLASLAELLGQRSENIFREEEPFLLEDLNRRGLLDSSATGEALARERGRLEQGVASQLQEQLLKDLDIEQDLAGDILDREFKLKEKGLDRSYDVADFEKQAKLARELAEEQAKAARESANIQAISQLFGTATGIVASKAI